jgi:competence protein ComEC
MPPILLITIVFCAAVTAGLFTGEPALYAAAVLGMTAPFTKQWLAIFAATGIALGGLQSEARNHACWRFQDGQQLEFTGVLESLPVSEKIVLRMTAPCEVTVPARLPKGKQVPPGYAFTAHGRWQNVAIVTNAVARPGGGTLIIMRIDSVTNRKHVLLLWRAQAQGRIRQLFPRHSGLAEALLVAQRDGLDAEVRARYAASGLTHLLAISGTHVALVAAVLWMLARMARLPRLTSHIVCVVGSTAYVFFLGAPFAAIRALMQIVMVIVARNLQRPAHPLGLVAGAALVIVGFYPHAVIDAGFQLSFAGIIAIGLWRRPLIERMPASVPVVLRDAVATTVAATVVTTPIAAFHFGTVSTIALVANLLAIPAVSLAVPASAAALAVSFISMPAAQFVAAGAEISLASLDRVANVSAAVPHGHFAAHPRQLIDLVQPRLNANAQLQIHMIDVGQGDGIALRTPRGRWIVVDAGPASPTYDAGAKRMVPYLLRRGVRTIDALIITHPHLDHFGGVGALIETFGIEMIYDPGVAIDASAYDRLLATAQSRGTRWQTVRAGTRLEIDGVTMDFLHPDTIFLDASEDPNDYSVIFRLEYGRFSALFTGDASTEVEERLNRRYSERLDVDVLKVGHHGSGTSTGAELLTQTTPALALISLGRRNHYRHPSPHVIERLTAAGVQVLRTDLQGNITLQIGKDGRIEARTGQ